MPPYRFGTSATTWLSVSADNAYLPANIRAQMSGPGGGNPAGPAFLNIGRINEDWTGNSRIENTNTTKRFVTGLEGDLNDNWSWDAYYQYGQNTYYGTVQDNLITSRGGVTARGNVNLAVDAVVAPAGNAAGITPGTIVCRSTLTDPTNGCVPYNPFGIGVNSAAAINYLQGRYGWAINRLNQKVAAASVSGEVSGSIARSRARRRHSRSMATRASYRSSVSWMSSGRRMKPRVHGTRKPSVTSRASASRTGVRLTPRRPASSISLMRSPGLNW